MRVKELEERIEAGRRGEEIDVDVAFPDLLGDDDSGMDMLLSTNTQDLLETIDLSVFD